MNFPRFLEDTLGSWQAPTHPFSIAETLRLDEAEAFPEDACERLNHWGLNAFYVPEHLGGQLNSFKVLFELLRLISRRDLTMAIGHGKTYLGAVAVWVAGNSAQQAALAKLILDYGIVSLGLTEKDHGSDLAANELQYTDGQLMGEKWLINNATRGDALTLFAKTSNDNTARNYSLLFIPKKILDPAAFYYLAKIKTHGIRGADMSGIGFRQAQIDSSHFIGNAGSGLEITLKSLQISRTLCASLSLGAGDTALRIALDFAHHRHLYGLNLTQMTHVKEVLQGAFLDLLTCEALALFGLRCLHFCPELMSLYSSVIKYYIPITIEAVFERLTGILGARSYLREAHDLGLFQKMLRDQRLISLFDGSTIVNLQNIAHQINFIVKKAQYAPQSAEQFIAFTDIFCIDKAVPPFNPSQLSLSVHGQDLFSYPPTTARTRLFESISSRSYFIDKMDQEKAQRLHEYCALTASTALQRFLTDGSLCRVSPHNSMLLERCLLRLASRPYADDLLWACLQQLHQQQQLFSFDPMQLL